MLEPEELESIYNLLHSPVEDNVNLALAIIEGREDVKRVFDECLRKFKLELISYMQNAHMEPNTKAIIGYAYKIIGRRHLLNFSGKYSISAICELNHELWQAAHKCEIRKCILSQMIFQMKNPYDFKDIVVANVV